MRSRGSDVSGDLRHIRALLLKVGFREPVPSGRQM